MHPLTYLHFQLQLEGVVVVDERLTRDAQAPADQDPPLVMVARLTTQEVVVYYHESIESALQKKLAACVPRLQFPNTDALLEVLKKHERPAESTHYLTYVFPPSSANATDRMVLRYPKADPRIRAFGFNAFSDYVYGIEQSGQVISACVSTRENELCGEAWVQTAPSYRRQGLACKVVNAWAKSLMAMGKIPFYTHRADNDASAGLAKRLGLEPIFEEINITSIQN